MVTTSSRPAREAASSSQPARPPSAAPVVLVTGRRGCGKTTYLRQLVNREPRFLVFDHMAEFARSIPGSVTVYELDQAIAFLKHRPAGIARVVYCPVTPSPELFNVVCRVPFAVPDVLVVVDEIDTYAGAVNPPPSPEFRRLIHFGRHVGSGFVGASRRPADVARLFSSQATRIVCFSQIEPNDLRWLRSVIGPDADRLPELPALHYLSFEPGQAVHSGAVDPTAT